MAGTPMLLPHTPRRRMLPPPDQTRERSVPGRTAGPRRHEPHHMRPRRRSFHPRTELLTAAAAITIVSVAACATNPGASGTATAPLPAAAASPAADQPNALTA